MMCSRMQHEGFGMMEHSSRLLIDGVGAIEKAWRCFLDTGTYHSLSDTLQSLLLLSSCVTTLFVEWDETY